MRNLDLNWAHRTVGYSNADNKEARAKVLDGFSTPAIAVEELLKRERFHKNIWEPAAGLFAIVDVLRSKGYTVASSDICRWHRYLQCQQDFLTFRNTPLTNCDIITNPPFSKGMEFVKKSLELLQPGNKLALLLRLQFLEGKARKVLYDGEPLLRVYVFSYRLPRMTRFGYVGKETTSTFAFSWFIWEKGYKGRSEVKWI